MICQLCHGAQHLAGFPQGKVEHWDCPCCDGAGVQATAINPPTVRVHAIRNKALTKMNAAMDRAERVAQKQWEQERGL